MSLRRLALLLCTVLPSPLRLFVWRCFGFSVGRGAHVSMLSVVIADEIELGPGACIESLTLIYRPTSLVIGERSRIASFVRIIGFGNVRIARQAFVGLGCLIDCSG